MSYQAHAFIRCAGETRGGARCQATSWQDHAGAQPLREGERYCAKHAGQAGSVPEGAVCASCGGVAGLSKDSNTRVWYCAQCWDAWERDDDPLAGVWDVMFGGPHMYAGM